MQEGVSGELSLKTGVLKVTIFPGEARNSISAVCFGGTVKAEPEGILSRLETALADCTINDAPARIEDFFSQNPEALPGIEPEDILTVLTFAHMKIRRSVSTAPDPSAWKTPPKPRA